ncbi:MAG: serine hydrolase domain-containing protein, partial [Acidobacteriota bacterium]
MIRFGFLETLFLALLIVPTAGQSAKTSPDSKIGKSVDAFVRRKMAAEQIPGIQIAVLRKGRLIKSASYGVSNVELNSAVTDDTMFEIASNSKQFTAGAVLLLAEDGTLKLDDSITKHIDGLPEEYSGVMIRHLLNHTSGIKDYIEEFELN